MISRRLQIQRPRISPEIAVALFVAVLAVVVLPSFGTALTSDPVLYRDVAERTLSGEVPYVDFEVEHLPVALIPMILAWLGGGFVSDVAFRIVFAGLSTLMLIATWKVLVAGDRGRQGGRAWVVMIIPLIPLVLFRTEPTVVLLLALGLSVARRASAGGAAVTWAAAMTKGYPLVAVLEFWRRGNRRQAGFLLFAGLAGLATVGALPGFRSGRVFAGIHSETVFGALLGLVRTVSGGASGRIATAGATYIDAGIWVPAAQLVVFGGLAIWMSSRYLIADSSRTRWALGGIVLAATLSLPLFSAQFVIWCTPFLAFFENRRVRVALAVAGALTTLSALLFDGLIDDAWWWYGLVSVRNVILVGVLTAVAVPLVRPWS